VIRELNSDQSVSASGGFLLYAVQMCWLSLSLMKAGCYSGAEIGAARAENRTSGSGRWAALEQNAVERERSVEREVAERERGYRISAERLFRRSHCAQMHAPSTISMFRITC